MDSIYNGFIFYIKMIKLIKVVNEEELNIALEIRNKVFILECQVPIEIEVDSLDSLNSEAVHFLYMFNDKIIGTLRATKEKGFIRFQRLAILKEYRKQGFGKEALSLTEKYFIDKGYKSFTLDAKYKSKDFYLNCGYSIKSNVFIEANIPHVRMEKHFN